MCFRFRLLLHGMHYLKDAGVKVITLPHDVPLRGGNALKIDEAKKRHNAFLTELGLAPLP